MSAVLQQEAYKLGMRWPRYGWSVQHEQDAERKVYEAETGRSPAPKFTSGVGRAQWEYGLRGTDYWRKDAREGVRLISQVRT